MIEHKDVRAWFVASNKAQKLRDQIAELKAEADEAQREADDLQDKLTLPNSYSPAQFFLVEQGEPLVVVSNQGPKLQPYETLEPATPTLDDDIPF